MKVTAITKLVPKPTGGIQIMVTGGWRNRRPTVQENWRCEVSR